MVALWVKASAVSSMVRGSQEILRSSHIYRDGDELTAERGKLKKMLSPTLPKIKYGNAQFEPSPRYAINYFFYNVFLELNFQSSAIRGHPPGSVYPFLIPTGPLLDPKCRKVFI